MKTAARTTKPRIHRSKGKSIPLLAFFYLGMAGMCIVFADILPLPFSPQQLDVKHLYEPPFQWQMYQSNIPFHWLGTDHIGRDVLANIVYGFRTAFLLSMPAMAMATGLGALLGGIAGFYGNRTVKLSVATVGLLALSFLLAYYYGFYILQSNSKLPYFDQNIVETITCWFIFSCILLGGIYLSRQVNKRQLPVGHLYLPIDQLILKCIELSSSIPRIILILCLAAYTRPSLLNLILITGFTYWTEPARLIRAELLRIKAMNYIESAKAMGMADFYILIRHALPNSLSSIIVAATFGIAGLISLESTLSFLNIGMPADIASWGRMVASARSNFSAWWLVLFPGLALCCTVLSIQSVSNWLIYKLNPRNR